MFLPYLVVEESAHLYRLLSLDFIFEKKKKSEISTSTLALVVLNSKFLAFIEKELLNFYLHISKCPIELEFAQILVGKYS